MKKSRKRIFDEGSSRKDLRCRILEKRSSNRDPRERMFALDRRGRILEVDSWCWSNRERRLNSNHLDENPSTHTQRILPRRFRVTRATRWSRLPIVRGRLYRHASLSVGSWVQFPVGAHGTIDFFIMRWYSRCPQSAFLQQPFLHIGKLGSYIIKFNWKLVKIILSLSHYRNKPLF